MDLVTVIGIGIGLSLDAFAVSVTNATVIKGLELRHGLRMALFFGFFQMLMPVIGWAAGSTFSRYISGFDHWIAFGLLAFIGGRMIWASLREGKEEEADGCADGSPRDCRHLPTLFMLSIATSIDALAIGVSFAMIAVDIFVPVALIGGITFVICLGGYFLGTKIGHKINLRLEIFGGLVLVDIGVKILLEHLLK
jgi:putative Mn2+ efflux pump MntP